MGGFLEKFYFFCLNCIRILGLLFSAVLFAGGFLVTAYTADMESQTVLFRWDHFGWNLLGTAVFLLLFLPVLLKRKPAPRRLLAVTLLWCCVCGIFLILFGRTTPGGDGMSVYAAAQELAAGNTAVIDPDNSYFSYYPQQMGLVGFYEILIRFWNLLPVSVPAWHFLKCVNIAGACVILFFQDRTVHLLWQDQRTDCIYLLLAGLNLPFLMYTSFIYGEIPSFAFVSAGLYYALKFLKQGTRSAEWLSGLSAIACMAVGVALRKNNLIFVIALLIVAILQYLRERRLVRLLFVLLCMICTSGILPGIQKTYELRAGSYLRSGVPAAAYFAMGMQDVPGTRCGGWYNGFNFQVYQQAGLDTEAAVEASWEVIRERLAAFQENPGYAVRFYGRKHLSQWADGTYAARQATWSVAGGRSSLIQSLYEGELGTVFIEYANLYQNMLYLGLLVFCVCQCGEIVSRRRERRNADFGVQEYGDDSQTVLTGGLSLWIGLIGVIGGFLFHTIWEANSRYILLYSLAMLPYSAWGCRKLLERCEVLCRRLRK